MASKRTPTQRAKRAVTRQLLHDQGTHIQVSLGQLNRMANDEDKQYGLSKAEREFIKRRKIAIEHEVQMLSKLAIRMMQQEQTGA